VINLPTSSARVSTKQAARIYQASSAYLPSKQRASAQQAACICPESSVHLPVNYNLLVKLNDEEFLRRGRKKLLLFLSIS